MLPWRFIFELLLSSFGGGSRELEKMRKKLKKRGKEVTREAGKGLKILFGFLKSIEE